MARQKQIQVGSTVKLKSGGPAMTVKRLFYLTDIDTGNSSIEEVEVSYFNTYEELKSERLHKDALELVKQ